MSKVLSAVGGVGAAACLNGLYLARDLTAPVSYPISSAIFGNIIAKRFGFNGVAGGVLGGALGVIQVPFAPLILVGNAMSWPVSLVAGGFIGYNVK